MNENYVEDDIVWVSFDKLKYQILKENQIFAEEIGIYRNIITTNKNSSNIGLGFYSIKQIKDYLLKTRIFDFLNRSNVGTIRLPITRYNGKIYSVDEYTIAEWMNYVSTGRIFLLYQFREVNGSLIVRGVVV